MVVQEQLVSQESKKNLIKKRNGEHFNIVTFENTVFMVFAGVTIFFFQNMIHVKKIMFREREIFFIWNHYTIMLKEG